MEKNGEITDATPQDESPKPTPGIKVGCASDNCCQRRDPHSDPGHRVAEAVKSAVINK